jgi:hypothetical protein
MLGFIIIYVPDEVILLISFLAEFGVCINLCIPRVDWTVVIED